MEKGLKNTFKKFDNSSGLNSLSLKKWYKKRVKDLYKKSEISIKNESF